MTSRQLDPFRFSTLLLSLFTVAAMTVTSKAIPAAPIDRTPALSEPFTPPPTGHLFSSAEPLNIKLVAPLSTLFAVRKDVFRAKEVSVNGVVSYVDESKKKIDVPVEVHLKGFSTLAKCPFPKLELKMLPTQVSSIFSLVKSVDLNTHCAEPEDTSVDEWFRYSNYNHREAFIYRLMQIFEMPTLNARPAFIQYTDTDGFGIAQIKPGFTYQAFFLEDMSDFRHRLGVTEIKGFDDPMKQKIVLENPEKDSLFQFRSISESPRLDKEDFARIAIFQAMIGNGDWFVKQNANDQRFVGSPESLWNTKVIERPDRKWGLMAQDFSLSLLIMVPHSIDVKTSTVANLPSALKMKIARKFLSKKTDVQRALMTLKDDPQFTNFQAYFESVFSQLNGI